MGMDVIIEYGLPYGSDVRVVVYNLLGQEVRLLVNDKKKAGTHMVIWDGRDNAGEKASSGIYFLRFEA